MLSDIFNKIEYVNSFHHQCVHQLGKHLKISAAASDGIIEAIELEDHPFAAGVQWHPECMMDTSPSMEILLLKIQNAARNPIIEKTPSIFHENYGHTISEAIVVTTRTTAKSPAAAGQICKSALPAGIIRRKQTWQIYQYLTYRTFVT